MDLSLKAALTLRTEIEKRLKAFSLPLKGGVSVLVKDNIDKPDIALAEARAPLLVKMNQQEILSATLADLRIALSAANAKAGIDELLAKTAHIERMTARAKLLAEAPLTPSLEVLKGEMALAGTKLRNAASAQFYDPNDYRSVEFALVTQEIRDTALADLSRLRSEKEEVENKRLQVNLKTKIKIAEVQAEALRSIGVI